MTSIEIKQKKVIGFSTNALKALRSSQLLFYVGPVTAWVVLFVIFPLLIVFFYSFMYADVHGNIYTTFTLGNFSFIIEGLYLGIFLRTFSYTAVSTILCLIIGYAVAYWIAMYGGRWRVIFLFLIVIPQWTAYLIRLYALRNFLGTRGVLNNFLMEYNIISAPLEILYTPFAVMLGLVFTWLAFTILPLYASLVGLDSSVLKAASDLGAPPLNRFLRVTLPLTKGGIFAAVILVAIPALGEFVVPKILGGNKQMLIGNLIDFKFNQVANIPEGAAIAMALLLIVFALAYLLIKWGGEEVLERIL